MASEESIQFLIHRGAETPHRDSPPDGLSYKFWRPAFFDYKPKGLPFHPKFLVWWTFHHLRIFYNRGYAILLISDSNTVAHYSFVFPGFFRFGFMQRKHLQIGDVWPSPQYRNKGLAAFSINQITDQFASKETPIWYLVDSSNIPSVKAASKVGFSLVGEGIRTKKLGMRLLGEYQITKHLR